MHARLICMAAVCATTVSYRAGGEVTEFFDLSEWQAAVGPTVIIDFTGLPEFTFLSDEYAEYGILFPDGTDEVFSETSFQDGWGVAGNPEITIAYENPQYWIGVEYPGLLQVELFSGGESVFESGVFGQLYSFFGLVSDQPFDQAVLRDPIDNVVVIDNLYVAVPGPATGWALVAAALALPWSRRRRHYPRAGRANTVCWNMG